MKTKNILIVIGVVVLAGLIFFGFRYRKKRLVYKGEEVAQEQVASIVQQALDSEELNKLLRRKIEETDTVRIKDKAHEDYLAGQFHEIYELNQFQPLWLTAEGPTESANQLIDVVSKSDSEGLPSEMYQLNAIQTSIDSLFPLEKEEIDLEELLHTDFMISSAALRYGAHLRFGLIDPTRAAKYWKTYPGREGTNLGDFIYNAIKENKIPEAYASLTPKNPYYERMKTALAQIQGAQELPGKLESSVKLQYGDSGEQVALLRTLLQHHGVDLANGNQFDSALVNAVKEFQQLRGEADDGVVSKNTIAHLNRSRAELEEKMRLNLERTRWLSEEGRYLLVNIPEYRVRIYNGNKKEIEMKVIVGKEYTSTPVFTDTMEHIIFSPTWGVPNSIASGEMLPILKRDPSYLSRNNYKLYRNGREVSPSSVDWNSVSAGGFNYQIVQSPGSRNALGHVKFMFPNSMNIYLHDTPTDHLFSRNERMFSHGCIRVEKPAELAEYLLKPTGDWPMERIKENFGMSSPKKVNLPEKLPVQIFYMTAWVDEDGHLQDREDIYGHDKEQLKMLREALQETQSDRPVIAEVN